MRDPNAVVYLVPGVGMITFAKDKATARISGEFYVNAINVMRGASSVSEYVGLPEQEAFDIEYWLLEEAKLQRMPKPKSLAGRVALVTGGAGGIGAATAERYSVRRGLRDAGRHQRGRSGRDREQPDVALSARTWCARRHERHGRDGGCGALCRCGCGIRWRRYSGVQCRNRFVGPGRRNHAGVVEQEHGHPEHRLFPGQPRSLQADASAGHWRRGHSLSLQRTGLAASPNASAYCTAKAAEIHLARCLALEGAEAGIRVNVVNPDAVLRGSKIWEGEWLEQRAGTYGTDKSGLEEMYRQRSLLKRSVLPEDIAEAAYFFAADVSAKSTGNILNVDAGNVQAFTR